MNKVIAFLTMITLSMIVFTSTASAATHTVTKGETLYSIAKKYNVTITSIKQLNNLTSDNLKLNQKLQITGKAVTTTAKANVQATTTHTVAKGDTLNSIAKKYGVTVANLKAWNGLKSDAISIGKKLSVKGAAVTTASVSRDSADDTVVKTIRVSSTAYTASCAGCSGITTTGLNLKKNPGLKVIAVDPKVIPLGSKVWVEGYGYAVAGDTGGAVKGNKIDVFISNKSEALKWGRRTVTVKVLK